MDGLRRRLMSTLLSNRVSEEISLMELRGFEPLAS